MDTKLSCILYMENAWMDEQSEMWVCIGCECVFYWARTQQAQFILCMSHVMVKIVKLWAWQVHSIYNTVVPGVALICILFFKVKAYFSILHILSYTGILPIKEKNIKALSAIFYCISVWFIITYHSKGWLILFN